MAIYAGYTLPMIKQLFLTKDKYTVVGTLYKAGEELFLYSCR